MLIVLMAALVESVMKVKAGSTVETYAQREQKLQQSIDRMTALREQAYNELLAAKQELAAFKAQQAIIMRSNQVIVIRIELPPMARPAEVKVEQE